MDNKRSRDNDAYDELLKSFSAAADMPAVDDDIKNHGEIYFSMNTPQGTNTKTPAPEKRQPVKRASGSKRKDSKKS